MTALARMTGDTPLHLTLRTRSGNGPAQPAELLTLRSTDQDDAELDIDPMTRHPAGVFPAADARVRE